MRGWLPLNESGQGFVGLEVRDSPDRGGLGVFVTEGYRLEVGCTFPYFGKWGPKGPEEAHDNHYLVGPYKGKNGQNYIDGNPEKLANNKNNATSSLWAGPRVNQANTPEERNCRMIAVAQREAIAHRPEYAAEYAEPVRCAMVITRVLHSGDEVLTNYSWDRQAQMDRQCGYDYYKEIILGQKGVGGEIQDEDDLEESFLEGEGMEGDEEEEE